MSIDFPLGHPRSPGARARACRFLMDHPATLALRAVVGINRGDTEFTVYDGRLGPGYSVVYAPGVREFWLQDTFDKFLALAIAKGKEVSEDDIRFLRRVRTHSDKCKPEHLIVSPENQTAYCVNCGNMLRADLAVPDGRIRQ